MQEPGALCLAGINLLPASVYFKSRVAAMVRMITGGGGVGNQEKVGKKGASLK